MFSSIFKNAAQITTNEVLICAAVAFAIGIALAVCYLLIENAKRGFTVTLLLLPIICDGIIMLVNGFATNGLSLAITLAGVFALVRFRSVPASAKDILLIMIALLAGLACATGRIYFALLFSLASAVVIVICYFIPVRLPSERVRELKIKTPEDLDYTVAFKDIFATYCKNVRLKRCKTTNLGSLNEITYYVELKNEAEFKKFMDELRFINGNLPIMLKDPAEEKEQL
ncbi:MAG: DUF4956 domain-containing protein [Clostridia bacterium]|nr:DUF4956 domain-containing protein [Clostridia bacterium]